MRPYEAAEYIEGLSKQEISELSHDEASEFIGLFDTEYLNIESLLDEIFLDGYDDYYTPARTSELEDDMQRFRNLSQKVERLAIAQYM